MSDVDEGLARLMWQRLEPVHAVTYFAPESAAAYRHAGLKGFWMGYFAGRAAPMGPVVAAVVEATFYNFAPALVRRAIPDAWTFSSVERVLEARLAGARGALGPVVVMVLEPDALQRAGELAVGALGDLDTGGRPLAAANRALPVPDDPVGALWHAATVLREHRGDGHVATLVDAGLDGCEAHVTAVAAGTVPRTVLQPARGFTDEEWEAAAERLRGRGLLHDDGTLTAAGRDLRRRVEEATDRLALAPWARLGVARTEELASLVGPLAAAVSGAIVPIPNPIGLPAPT